MVCPSRATSRRRRTCSSVYVRGGSPLAFIRSGYCQQTDTHVKSATVREALLFSAQLRQPASVPLAEKEA